MKPKKVAVIIGNGRSRLVYDLWLLKKCPVTTYGCNSIYKDFAADFVAAVDPPMQSELRQNYVYTRMLWTDSMRSVILRGSEVVCELPGPYGWDSGRVAIRAAVADGATDIYLLGFDFFDADDIDNNVYHDSHPARRPRNYADIWNHLFASFHTRFVRVGPQEDEFLEQLLNVEFIDYGQFAKEVSEISYSGRN